MAWSRPQYAALRGAFAILRTRSVGVAVCTLAFSVTSHAAPSCAEWHAVLTAVEGVVDVKRASESVWRSGSSGESLCYGDAVSVKTSSRATLTLPDLSTLRLDENTAVTLDEPTVTGGSLINLLRGVIHVISRDPRYLKFKTPYANAGLEGTEFDIRVSEREPQTEVVVLEGKVAMSTPAGDLGVPSGQIAVARSGEPPSARPLQEPIELMRWTGHYPRIVDRTLPAADEPAPPRADADFFARRAAARLETARIDAAAADLDQSLSIEQEQPTALALRAIVALGRADHDGAIRLATAATAAASASADGWLALSYAQEGVADLDGAMSSAMRAVRIEPDNALARSRLAALFLANGDRKASFENATIAARLAPSRAEPATVLGFVYLSQLDSAAARDAFDGAVDLEPSAPLPRLGLGLAMIMAGDFDGGRQQLELAVTFDPTNALTRSYMAKVYEAEHRAKLTGSQLDLAKRFDPLDPTPWLYGALQKLNANRPVEAFQDLQSATTKNANRITLRSRLTVDADLATSSSSIARVNGELAFNRLALADAWEAVTGNPGDYAGHRMLADAYSREPREEIARVSEEYVAQLQQPANLTPIPAQLGQPGTFLAAHLGPGPAAFNELGSPVTQNGLRLQTSGSTGDNGTVGTEVTVAGLHDGLSWSFGHYRFATDGFRANNDRDQRAANALVQFRPAPATSLQVELRSTRVNEGDISANFDPQFFSPDLRLANSSDSIRFGARHDFTDRDTLLASAAHALYQNRITSADIFSSVDDGRQNAVDVQFMHNAGALRLQTGVAHGRLTNLNETSLTIGAGPSILSSAQELFVKTDVYAYALFDPTRSVTITAGAAWNRVSGQILDEQTVNPKLGVTWRLNSSTTLRAAAFRSLLGALTSSRQAVQPRLEPSQVAGFSQLLFGGLDDRSTVRGLAVDHRLSERLFVGLEASTRETERGVADASAPVGSQVTTVTFRERTQQAYLYWTPDTRLAFSAKVERGRYASEPLIQGTPLFNYTDLAIERIPIELRYFSPTGLVLGFRTSHIKDQGTFLTMTPTPFTLAQGEDRFWLVDAFVGYRLPNRRGLLSLNADNLLDRRFRFQDVDPEDTTLIPERLFSFRFTLSFN